MTKSQSEQMWLAKRKQGIGASEAAAALGLSPWKSRWWLYKEKRGEIEPEDISDNQRVYWGSHLEAPIRARCKQELQQKIDNPGKYKIQQSPQHPHMICTLDGVIPEITDEVRRRFAESEVPDDIDGPGVLEIKTAGDMTRQNWQDDRWPLHYQCQVQHQMEVTGYGWGMLAVLIGGWDFSLFPFVRHAAFCDMMVAREAEFWRQVQDGDEPPVDGSNATKEALKLLHPDDNGEEIELPAEAIEWHHALAAVKADRKKIDEDIRYYENQLRAAIGDASAGVLPTGDRYTLRSQTRKEHVVKASTFRVLRFKGAKK